MVFDSEQSLARDHVPLDVFSVQDRLVDESGIICQQLPPGVHAKRVERKIGHWKGKIRSCNMDPTDANINQNESSIIPDKRRAD